MWENGINIYNLYFIILSIWKKPVKCLKITFLGPYLGKNRASIDHAQNQVQLFLEITKGDQI